MIDAEQDSVLGGNSPVDRAFHHTGPEKHRSRSGFWRTWL
jgi:hypothetical protein